MGPRPHLSQLNRSAVGWGGVSSQAMAEGTPGKLTVCGTPSRGPLPSWSPKSTPGPAEGRAHPGSRPMPGYLPQGLPASWCGSSLSGA